MHTFQPLPFDLVEFNPFTKIGKEWALVTAGNKEKANTMTVSWGGVGVLWGKNVAFIFVRDSRYTKEFIDANEFFSITFLSGQYRDALNYCGSHSGRDEDKFAAAGLTLATRHNIPYVDEGNFVLLCEKMSATRITEDSFLLPEIQEKWYKDGVVDPEFITGENKGGYWAISHQFVNGIIGFTTHGMSYHWEPKAFVDSDESTSGQDRYELEKLDVKAAESLEVRGIPPYISKETQKTYPKRDYVRGERWMFSKALIEDEEKFNKLLEIYNDIYASKENFDYANSGERGVVWEYEEAVSTNGKTYKRAVNLGDWKDEEYRKKNKFSFNLFTPSFPDSEKIVTPRDDWAVPRGFDELYMPNNRLYVSLPSENTYSAELDKIEEETYIDIITGAKPVDYFDEFVEKWRSSGGAKLEEEAEAWYREVNE